MQSLTDQMKTGPTYALDFETTGVDPWTCRPVSVALAVVRPGGELDRDASYQATIDAGVDVPPGAAAIHGLTTERVRAEGIPADHALQDLIARLRDVVRIGRPIVIYNAPFDWTLLQAEAARHGRSDILADATILDALVCDRTLDKYRKGGRTLAATSKVYGIKLDDAHDAMADAVAAARIAQEIVAANHNPLGRMTAGQAHDLQASWYETWRVDCNAYWERTGKDRRQVAGWPIRGQEEE